MSNEAKVEMVPMLQDMRTYITNHYWSEILCEVEEQLPGFKAQMPPWTQGTQLFLHHEESKIVKADFWRRSRTKMSADLYVRLKIGASKNGELPRYFVENMYLSTDFVLDGTIQWLSESTVLLDECPEREGWTKLSKYLVPIFSYDDMELQVQNMLKAYLGEIAVTAYQPRAAWKLAKAMELQISSAPLFKIGGRKRFCFPRRNRTSRETGGRRNSDGRNGCSCENHSAQFQCKVLPTRRQ